MANTDFSEISIVEEVAEGQLPVNANVATPVMQQLNKISITPNPGKQYAESPESRGDRLDIESDLVSFDPTYQMTALLRPRVFDSVIASCLRSDWVQFTNRKNRLNLNLAEVNAVAAAPTKEITAVANATDEYTVTNGSVFPPQAMVLAENFTDPANNGIKIADATSTGTTLIIAATGTLVDEVPPNGAKLTMIGVEGAAGEILATATGLTWTGFDWDDYGAFDGMWLVVGGPAVGNRFNGHAVAGVTRQPIMMCRVAVGGVQGADLVFDRKPSNWAVDAGAGKQIRVYFLEHIKIGSTAKTHSIQVKTNRRRAAAAIRRFSGLHGSVLSMSGAARDRITLDAQMRGPLYEDNATDLSAGAVALPSYRSFLTRRFGQIFADGTQQRIPVATGTVVLNPNLLPAEEWGFDAFGDYDAATQMTGFQGELQFESDYARDKFHGEAFGDLFLPWERDGYFYGHEFSRYQFSALSEPISGRGALVKQQFEGKGVANDDATAFNNQYVGWRGYIEARAG